MPHALADLDWLETYWSPAANDDETVLHRNLAAVTSIRPGRDSDSP